MSEVVRLVNAERAKESLAALDADSALDGTALVKARDMAVNNYFEHVSPSGVSLADLYRDYGIPYHYGGENLALGYETPASVVEAWMNSAGHRANIMNVNYTKIGVGIVRNASDVYYWVQHFTG